jgi:2-methylcitrate dehydratase PrpD
MEDQAIYGHHGVIEPLSLGIGRFVSGLDVAALRSGEVKALRFTVADYLASALAGAEESATKASIAILADNYGRNGAATILGHRDRATALAAAMVNGTMAHACDFDDVSEPMCGHPTAPALPAILALAEIRGGSGSDVLVALAAALEVMTKLGRIAGYELYRSGWHPTAALGVFGAAAGAAKILGLDAERTATAISIAASRAAGVRANIGTTVKPLHCGFAARDGLECALFASAGATANAHALEGPNGFLKAFTPQHDDIQALVESLGNPFDISEPGIDFKKYPSCWDTHSAIEAALYLRTTYSIEPAEVKAIRCVLAPGMGADLVYPRPSTPLQGKFSMEFCVAIATLHGRVSLTDFVQASVDSPAVRALIDVATLAYDQALASGDAKSFCAAARVDIDLKDGRSMSKTVTYMRGHPKNPMSPEEFEQKFRDCAEPVLGTERANEALKIIGQLDKLRDIRALTSKLVPPS